MKAVRDRMRKINLLGGTKIEAISGAGPDEQLSKTGTTPSVGVESIFIERGAKQPRAGVERRQPQKRRITKVHRGDLVGLYDLGGHVMESAHPGVEVRFGRRRYDGEHVVIKTFEKSTYFADVREERKWRGTTVAQLNMPKNEGMCGYFAVYETWEKYFVVMERVMGMDLFDHLDQGQIAQEDVREILFQVLGALRAMHAAGRIHKDLKLENIVVDLSSQESPTKACGVGSSRPRSTKMCKVSSTGSRTSVAAKLIDFDDAEDWKPSSPKAKHVLGTAGYIAPEAYSGDYSPASDVFAVGVVMYRLLTGRLPSRLENFAHAHGENYVGSPAMRRIQYRFSDLRVDFELPPLNELPDAQDLVKKMMAFDASERPSAAEALEHPWFEHAGELAMGRRPSDASTAVGSSRAPSGESTSSAASSAPAPALAAALAAAAAPPTAEGPALPGVLK